MGAMCRARGVNRLPVGVIGRKSRLAPGNASSGLAGFERFGAREVVQAATSMGFEIGERFVLSGQISEGPSQQAMFVDIRQISGVIAVLIREHDVSLFAMTQELGRHDKTVLCKKPLTDLPSHLLLVHKIAKTCTILKLPSREAPERAL